MCGFGSTFKRGCPFLLYQAPAVNVINYVFVSSLLKH